MLFVRQNILDVFWCPEQTALVHARNLETSNYVASNTNVGVTCRVIPRHAVLLSYRDPNSSGQGEILRQRHLHLVLHGRFVVELRRLKAR